MILRLLGLSLFCTTSLIAQFSFGFLGGVPFNDLTNGDYGTTDHSAKYTLGATVQLGLPRGFRLEADALYRPLAITSYSTSQWRFPILLQYRFSGLPIKPFVEGGYSYDHVNLIVPHTPTLIVDPRHGFVVGAGLDFKIPFFFRVSPEIRYTYDAGGPKTGNLLSTNQAEILVGIRF